MASARTSHVGQDSSRPTPPASNVRRSAFLAVPVFHVRVKAHACQQSAKPDTSKVDLLHVRDVHLNASLASMRAVLARLFMTASAPRAPLSPFKEEPAKPATKKASAQASSATLAFSSRKKRAKSAPSCTLQEEYATNALQMASAHHCLAILAFTRQMRERHVWRALPLAVSMSTREVPAQKKQTAPVLHATSQLRTVCAPNAQPKAHVQT
mmetsp:Transcript_95057/g.168824  ORF Transcript_95057/g.168824 Transcript_95057/m.168824 type:complete len:211 (-) Transcript_95057:2786-3418(-)